MSTTFTPATIRKVEKYVTEWQTLRAEIDRMHVKVSKLPNGARLREAQKELHKLCARAHRCHDIVVRSLFTK